jgi:hypothetical protein
MPWAHYISNYTIGNRFNQEKTRKNEFGLPVLFKLALTLEKQEKIKL